MTEEKIPFEKLKARYMEENNLTEEELEPIETYIKKVAVLRFRENPEKGGVMSDYQKHRVFVENGYVKAVSVGDIWLCSISVYTNTVSYAMPLIKITPMLLMNFDENLRKDIIRGLWEKNKSGYEKDFEKLYREEIYAKAQAELKDNYESQIIDQRNKISELESQVEQSKILLNARTQDYQSDMEMISLSSAPLDESGSIESVPDAFVQKKEERPMSIPSSTVAPMPGFPEVRTNEVMAPFAMSKMVFKVRRTKEDVLFSESFIDPKYFVHITPDCKLLVIRPHPYGSALAINKKITLKGLGVLSEFKGEKELSAEYSLRFDGLVVHL